MNNFPPTHETIQKKDQTGLQSSFFDRIAFLGQTGKKKAEIADKVLTDLYAGKLYIFEIFLSAVIAALGLLINSTAVVIGAMLIAPILRPIQGMAFSISTGSNSLYFKSGRLLIVSILASIGVSALIAFIVPFDAPTEEILARTTPTIIDLMIALSGGIIALLSLGFTRLSESVAGVAMAASLIPPLCVSGIGIAWMNWDIARGSFLLFMANLVAIIVVGVIIFYAFGFYPTNKKGQKVSAMQLLLVLLTTIIVSAPLFTGLQSIVRDFEIKSGIQTAITSSLPGIDSRARLESFDYTLENTIVSVLATLRTSDTTKITPADKVTLIQAIANTIDKPVSLTLELVPTTSIYVPKTQEPTLQQTVSQALTRYANDVDGLFLVEASIKNTTERPLIAVQFYSEISRDYLQIQADVLDVLLPFFQQTPLLVLDLQVNPQRQESLVTTGQMLQEILIKQITTLFPSVELNDLYVSQGTKVTQLLVESGSLASTGVSVGSDTQHSISQFFDVMTISLDLGSSLPKQTILSGLNVWKQTLEQEYDVLIELDVQLRAFDTFRVE